jgi:hypothetical protein
MTDADETRSPESPEERKLTPEQSEAFDTARGFADLQMMAAQEDKTADPDQDEGPDRLPLPAGCRRSTVAALIALVLIVVAFGFYLARLGSDPSKALQGVNASTAPQKGTQSGADSGSQDAPTQVGGSPTGAHDDSVPHVGQEWRPTYTQAGEWQIAMAREELLLRDNVEDRYAKDGHKMLLVEVNVVNNGSVQRRIDPSYFSLKADDGTVYPAIGVQPQDVGPNGTAWLETYYEVPTGTQGVLAFTPPESMGGKATDVPLPQAEW